MTTRWEPIEPGVADVTGSLDRARHPVVRPRRLRRSAAIRALVRETRLDADDLILPVFVAAGEDLRRPIESMPGIYQWSVDRVVGHAQAAAEAGVRAVLLFGIPGAKDPIGEENYAPDGVVQRAVAAVKARLPDLLVITDVCLCEYTDHGHCGVLSEETDGDPEILNDETLEILGRVAVSHADAGADIVAPSGMMDGMVGAIRAALDHARYDQVAILSYSAKYASGFYGPFRDAAQGAPRFGDRSTHQMDPANAREARRENALDVREGADMLMVKPALPYLDVIRQTREQFSDIPLVAYSVSGEYAMLKAAAEREWLDERRCVLEALTSIRRAGADLIITYHAVDAARWLGQ